MGFRELGLIGARLPGVKELHAELSQPPCLVQKESCSSSLPFLASTGQILIFIFFLLTPPPFCLLFSCELPKGWAFCYLPGEALSYQDVPTDACLSFPLLLHTPFCFTPEGSSPPGACPSRVSRCFHPCLRFPSTVNPCSGCLTVVPSDRLVFRLKKTKTLP